MPAERFWHDTIRGWGRALAEVKPFEDDFGLSEAYEEGYRRAVFNMHMDLGMTSTEFNRICEAAIKQSKDPQ